MKETKRAKDETWKKKQNKKRKIKHVRRNSCKSSK